MICPTEYISLFSVVIVVVLYFLSCVQEYFHVLAFSLSFFLSHPLFRHPFSSLPFYLSMYSAESAVECASSTSAASLGRDDLSLSIENSCDASV